MIVKQDEENNYILFRSLLIEKNYKDFLSSARIAHDRFVYNFPQQDSTKFYRYYNVFCLSAGCEKFYALFNELKNMIRIYYKNSDPLWMQCWLNFHTSSEVLNWHKHRDSLFHGYISIDPKKTVTEFENFKIVNEIGNVYIGPSMLNHRVCVIEPYEDYRITLGFDLFDKNSIDSLVLKHGSNINIGMIPV
jgi:hypothetical protein